LLGIFLRLAACSTSPSFHLEAAERYVGLAEKYGMTPTELALAWAAGMSDFNGRHPMVMM